MAEPTTDQWQQIQAALFANRKIQAIKIYRQATGTGLKEAKDAMDAYDARLREESPDRFAPRAKSGCFSMILLPLFLAAAGFTAAFVANHWFS